jgi:hypothetical protein
MAFIELARLRYRSAQLGKKMQSGSAADIKIARELLRLSLVELYRLGHWRSHPDQLCDYMSLYRAAEPKISAPESMSAPDKRDRYSP